jgi:hypothetical protein
MITSGKCTDSSTAQGMANPRMGLNSKIFDAGCHQLTDKNMRSISPTARAAAA